MTFYSFNSILRNIIVEKFSGCSYSSIKFDWIWLKVQVVNFQKKKQFSFFSLSGHMEFIKKTSCFWFESKLLIFVTRMVFASVQVYILFLIYEIHKNGIDLYFILSYGANSCSYVFVSKIRVNTNTNTFFDWFTSTAFE